MHSIYFTKLLQVLQSLELRRFNYFLHIAWQDDVTMNTIYYFVATHSGSVNKYTNHKLKNLKLHKINLRLQFVSDNKDN
jgi:hypothetical protein